MLALWQADRRGVFPAQEKKFLLTNSAQHECEQKGNEEEETRRERNLISEAGVQADLMQGHGVWVHKHWGGRRQILIICQ